MPAAWSITHWPVCEYRVFLSHCAEDRERLVLPVYRRQQQSGITPWIDQHDYPSVKRNDPRLARSVWRTLIYRGRFLPARMHRIGWAAAEIERFLRQEQRVGRTDESCDRP